MTKFTFCEFFAGGSWRCMFANDFDEKKVSTYKANWGAADIAHCDVASLLTLDLPTKAVDLVWASFPCQDLRSPGGRGLGREQDDSWTRSGTFWPFWRLVRDLARRGAAPRTIVLENVLGCLTSHGGRDFAAIASALCESDYNFGATVIELDPGFRTIG
jgi:DNA (cytosine-5)-methyltransferase 1